MNPEPISFREMDSSAAKTVLGWRYDAPYDFYNFPATGVEREVRGLLAPDNHFFQILDGGGGLIAYCCFGREGRVPGGDYSADGLDVGLMLRPDLTGRGLGRAVAGAVLTFGAEHYHPGRFRVTIAAFNQRAQKVWRALGFAQASRFEEAGSNVPFVILTKIADSGAGSNV